MALKITLSFEGGMKNTHWRITGLWCWVPFRDGVSGSTSVEAKVAQIAGSFIEARLADSGDAAATMRRSAGRRSWRRGGSLYAVTRQTSSARFLCLPLSDRITNHPLTSETANPPNTVQNRHTLLRGEERSGRVNEEEKAINPGKRTLRLRFPAHGMAGKKNGDPFHGSIPGSWSERLTARLRPLRTGTKGPPRAKPWSIAKR